VLNIEDQATIPLQRVRVPMRTALSNCRGGARWGLSGMPRPLLLLTFFFLDGFQAIICSALKLLDKGKRKEKKRVYQSKQVRE
jgi:hypothetical protein